MNDVEQLLIYKSNFNLIYYAEMILQKYPKIERTMLVKDIRETNIKIMELIIKVHKEINKNKKFYYLNEIDINLKLLKFFIRLSFKKKYITSRNYNAWSRKLTNVHNLLFNWMKNVQND